MAIAFARAEYKSRASGGNAVRSAAYNSRSDIRDERTGDRFDFSHQAKVGDVHLGVLLPDGARADFMDPATLWNAAEKAERRKDSQVAREVVIALPKEGSREDHITLARTFAMTHFVSKGVAAQVDIHAPDGDGDNWHAHILITTRRVTAQGLEAKKARDLDPVVVSSRGRAKVVSEEERWGQLWAEHQNEYFKAQGLDLRVDRTGAVSQEHLGPKRFRAPEAQEARDERAEAEARTLKAWRDPASVLDLMTRTRSTFTTADLDRELAKALPVEDERAAVRAAVLAHPALVRLRDADGAEIARFSTVDVIAQERRTLADAASVAQRRHAVGAQQTEVAIEGRTMRPDQLRACHAAWSGDGLVVIEGRAGVGKSYAIGAIAEGYSRSGYTVVGLGPTNLVGLELAAEAHVSRGGTLHSELWHVEQGKRIWGTRTVVIVDEAAMVDSRTMGRLMAAAARSGAKVILVGDDRQLASVERGGLFSELRDRHGSVVIEKVTRQRQDWQREAAEDLAAGRHDRAVQAFADRGCIRWTQTQDEALGALVGQWARDTADRPGKSRFVFAYTNDDVDKLNMALRLVRGLRGEIGDDHALVTDRGVREFAVGDRVQITRTDKSVGMVNGTVGTITGIRGSHVMMRLDNGKTVAWNAEEFSGFRHGYAGTIYKGQGRTIDETYLYHSHHWRSAASYVALTRQRDSALVFAATETAQDTAALARQMARADDRKAASAYVPEAEWFQARAQEEAARKVAEAEAQARAEAARMAEVEALRKLLMDGRSITIAQERTTIAGLSPEQMDAVQRHWPDLWETARFIAAAQEDLNLRIQAAEEAARKAQERPQASPAPMQPPPAQTASTARPAPRMTHGDVMRRVHDAAAAIDRYLAIAANPRSTTPEQRRAARAVAPPKELWPLVKAARLSGVPSEIRTALEVAAGHPNAVFAARAASTAAGALKQIGDRLAKAARKESALQWEAKGAADQLAWGRNRLSELVNRASAQPDAAMSYIERLCEHWRKHPPTLEQMEGFKRNPELLVEQLRGGTVFGRAERREALEALEDVFSAVLSHKARLDSEAQAREALTAFQSGPEGRQMQKDRALLVALKPAFGQGDPVQELRAAATALEQWATPAMMQEAGMTVGDIMRAQEAQHRAQIEAAQQEQDYGPTL